MCVTFDDKYTANSIKILKGLDAVRKRPDMYIGSTEDDSGLYQLFFELIDNSIDEVLAGYCTEIVVTLYNDDYISVEDNGRGIPVSIIEEEGKTAAEVVLTVLHSGSKFDDTTYKISGGLHGVGVSVVNALSSSLFLCVYRDGFIYTQEYAKGQPITKLEKKGKSFLTGTIIAFKPDETIFKNVKLKSVLIKKRLQELSFLYSKIKIIYKRDILFKADTFYNKKITEYILPEKIFFSLGGLSEYILLLCTKTILIDDKVLYLNKNVSFGSLELALCWTNSYTETILCYTNGILQKDGGTHLTGFKNALTRLFIVNKNKTIVLAKRELTTYTGEAVREGLVAILSIRVQNPKFSTQTKNKLLSTDVKLILEDIIFTYLEDFFLENQSYAKKIFEKINTAIKIRETTRKVRDLTRKKIELEFISLPRCLTDCQTKNPEEAEIFIVEGDSAGGSVKQARSRKNQAVLPLKGKIINVEKALFEKVLTSIEVKSLFSALGCGFGKGVYSLQNLRYQTIIIMTDADVDGLHIRTLLLAFFFRYTPELLINGHIFIAQSPLYSVSISGQVYYFSNFIEVKKFMVWCFYYKKNTFIHVKSIYQELLFTIKKKLFNYYSFLETVCIKTLRDDNFCFLLFLFTFVDCYFTIIDIYNKEKMLFYVTNLEKQLVGKSLPYIFLSIVLQEFFLYNSFFWLPLFTYMKDGVSTFYCFSIEFLCSNEFSHLQVISNLFKNSYLKNKNFFEYLIENNFTFCTFTLSLIEKIGEKINLQRYKGLGEMNPTQLWETVMDYNKRVLQLVTIYAKKDIFFIFDMLMGNDIKERRRFIENNIISVFSVDF
jgi:DNA gyrase subunit B